MGTAKRERQKANRQAKIEQMAKQVKVQQRKRKGLRIGILAVGALALILVLWLVSRKDSAKEAEPQTSVPTSDAGAFDPTSSVTDGSVPASTLADTSATIAPPDASAAPGSFSPDATVEPPPSAAPASDPVKAAFTYGTTECPPAGGADKQTQTFPAPFKQCIDPAKTYTAEVETNMGKFTITFDAKKAPGAVNSFVSLARNKYFENVICHRIIKDFVVQCGDPTGTGTGGPGYTFADELPAAGEYKIGSIAMANAGPNTNGSQFFIITGAQGVALPPNYSLFGQVTAGQDIAVDKLGNVATGPDDKPTSEVKILKVTITEK